MLMLLLLLLLLPLCCNGDRIEVSGGGVVANAWQSSSAEGGCFNSSHSEYGDYKYLHTHEFGDRGYHWLLVQFTRAYIVNSVTIQARDNNKPSEFARAANISVHIAHAVDVSSTVQGSNCNAKFIGDVNSFFKCGVTPERVTENGATLTVKCDKKQATRFLLLRKFVRNKIVMNFKEMWMQGEVAAENISLDISQPLFTNRAANFTVRHSVTDPVPQHRCQLHNNFGRSFRFLGQTTPVKDADSLASHWSVTLDSLSSLSVDCTILFSKDSSEQSVSSEQLPVFTCSTANSSCNAVINYTGVIQVLVHSNADLDSRCSDLQLLQTLSSVTAGSLLFTVTNFTGIQSQFWLQGPVLIRFKTGAADASTGFAVSLSLGAETNFSIPAEVIRSHSGVRRIERIASPLQFHRENDTDSCRRVWVIVANQKLVILRFTQLNIDSDQQSVKIFAGSDLKLSSEPIFEHSKQLVTSPEIGNPGDVTVVFESARKCQAEVEFEFQLKDFVVEWKLSD